MKIKGMRNIPTVQGLAHRAVPSNREQAVSELARQEHERARLQRELNLWLSKKEQTEQRLQAVQERIKQLEQALYESCSDSSQATRTEGSPSGEEKGKKNWREIPLEY